MKYIPTIGLEAHVQLNLASKMFSSSSSLANQPVNENASFVDLALPGMLPLINEEAIIQAIMFGKWINANINEMLTFDRKHYFYPDLPKGYQITQDVNPIVFDGKFQLSTKEGIKETSIVRAHLEEDAGKSTHDLFEDKTAIDFNRAGCALLEIVTGPDFTNVEDAIEFGKQLFQTVHYLGICAGSMKDGAFRMDLNVSIAPENSDKLGSRVEIKNLNSFKNMQLALKYEIERQQKALGNNEDIVQETRLFDTKELVTKSMRKKEDAADYKYMNEPDLLDQKLPIHLLDLAVKRLPLSPKEKIDNISSSFTLDERQVNLLMQDLPLLDLLANVIKKSKDKKLVNHWVFTEYLARINKFNSSVATAPVNGNHLGELINLIETDKLSAPSAKEVLDYMWSNEFKRPTDVVKLLDLSQVTDSKIIEGEIIQVIKDNKDKHTQYLNGMNKLYGFFVGQVMAKFKGKANPVVVNKLLKDVIERKDL